MADVGVCDSRERSLAVDLFEELLTDYGIEHHSLETAGIATEIDADALSDHRALYIRVGNVTEAVLEASRNLELVATCGSGYDHIDVEAATERGVMVTHTPGAPAPGAVEHTFALIFSLLHDLPELFSATASGEWASAQRPLQELNRRTVGVVGLGTIGSEVATTTAERFDADVIAYDPYVAGDRASDIYPRVSRSEIESHGIDLVDRTNLFERADLVSLHVPLTEDTEEMVSDQELKALTGGYLVNASRGRVVNEEALIDAVEQEQLAGVALDVMANEPPDASNPLLDAENVYITPHVAGGSEGYTERSARINADRIRAALDGDRPDGLVNPSVLDR